MVGGGLLEETASSGFAEDLPLLEVTALPTLPWSCRTMRSCAGEGGRGVPVLAQEERWYGEGVGVHVEGLGELPGRHGGAETEGGHVVLVVAVLQAKQCPAKRLRQAPLASLAGQVGGHFHVEPWFDQFEWDVHRVDGGVAVQDGRVLGFAVGWLALEGCNGGGLQLGGGGGRRGFGQLANAEDALVETGKGGGQAPEGGDGGRHGGARDGRGCMGANHITNTLNVCGCNGRSTADADVSRGTEGVCTGKSDLHYGRPDVKYGSYYTGGSTLR